MKLSATTAVVLVTMLLVATPGAAQEPKRLYCWNENGQRICGDRLPVEAVDNARTVFNAETGSKTAQVARALTEEELAARAKTEAAAEQAARAEAERRRKAMAMVASYTTEAELQHAYQTRITLADSSIQATQVNLDSLRQNLLDLLRRANTQELAGRPVPEKLASNIRDRHASLRQQQARMAEQQAERAQLNKDLEHALERYRELKAPESVPTG